VSNHPHYLIATLLLLLRRRRLIRTPLLTATCCGCIDLYLTAPAAAAADGAFFQDCQGLLEMNLLAFYEVIAHLHLNNVRVLWLGGLTVEGGLGEGLLASGTTCAQSQRQAPLPLLYSRLHPNPNRQKLLHDTVSTAAPCQPCGGHLANQRTAGDSCSVPTGSGAPGSMSSCCSTRPCSSTKAHSTISPLSHTKGTIIAAGGSGGLARPQIALLGSCAKCVDDDERWCL